MGKNGKLKEPKKWNGKWTQDPTTRENARRDDPEKPDPKKKNGWTYKDLGPADPPWEFIWTGGKEGRRRQLATHRDPRNFKYVYKRGWG